MNEKNMTIVQSMEKYLNNISLEEIRKKRGEHFRFPIYLGNELMQTDVTELELSVRSYNCLKRAGYNTIGELIENIDEKMDLMRIRNLGKKSADEIMNQLFYYQYSILSPERQGRYMARVLELNDIV